MSEPVLDSNHVSEGLALLTGDNAQKNIQGILSAWLAKVQDVENATNQVYVSRILANAVGSQLDLLGALVGEGRNNRTDANYRTGIRVRILISHSRGTPVDLVGIAVAGQPAAQHTFIPVGNGHWQMFEGNESQADALTLATAYRQAAALGTNGDVIYSSTATANSLVWNDVAITVAPTSVWDNVADTLHAGQWSAAA